MIELTEEDLDNVASLAQSVSDVLGRAEVPEDQRPALAQMIWTELRQAHGVNKAVRVSQEMQAKARELGADQGHVNMPMGVGYHGQKL